MSKTRPGLAALAILSATLGYLSVRPTPVKATDCTPDPSSEMTSGTSTFGCFTCTYFVGQRWLWSDVDTAIPDLPCDGLSDQRFGHAYVTLCNGAGTNIGTLTLRDALYNIIAQIALTDPDHDGTFEAVTGCYGRSNWPKWWQVTWGVDTVCIDTVEFFFGCCDCT